mgnify:CR=1 FL=1
MKTSLLVKIAALALTANVACATVSITFSNGGTGDVISGFGNAAGTPTAGMSYGLVVDTGNDGFGAGTWGALNPSASGFLNAAGSATDDFFTLGTSTGGPGFNTVDVGPPFGVIIIDMLGIDVLTNSLEGHQYGIMWFETGAATGDSYGFLATGITIANDGATIDDSAALSALSPGAASFQIAAVPEPSAFAAIAGMLTLGFVMVRRRRA